MIHQPTLEHPGQSIRMVDLFAGIGGIRLGVERAAQELGQHVQTVAASEIDPRFLSPREWARLQGFPDTYHLHPVKTHAYRHLGNSVPIPMITHAARPLIMHLTHLQGHHQ